MEKKSSILHKTAVLVFAASGKEDCNKKSIFHSEKLFSDFTRSTLRTVEKTGIHYFHLGENEQEGTNFAQRFTNAIQAVFDEGFEYVISVGNDTPELKSRHILFALEHLQEFGPVLGPSTDGGFYLMGIRKSDFIPEEFLQLPWQSRHILSAVQHLMYVKGRQIFLLERFMDIDNMNDLKIYISRHIHIPISIFNYCISYLQKQRRVFRYLRKAKSYYRISSLYNKGSPVTTFVLS